MQLYRIMLALFIFGFALTMINDLAFLNASVPETNYSGPGEAEIKDVTNQIQSTGLNSVFTPFVLVTMAKAFFSGVLAVITILPLFVTIMSAFGVPVWISVVIGMVIQGPLWLVTFNGAYQWWTGHNEQGME